MHCDLSRFQVKCCLVWVSPSKLYFLFMYVIPPGLFWSFIHSFLINCLCLFTDLMGFMKPPCFCFLHFQICPYPFYLCSLIQFSPHASLLLLCYNLIYLRYCNFTLLTLFSAPPFPSPIVRPQFLRNNVLYMSITPKKSRIHSTCIFTLERWNTYIS